MSGAGVGSVSVPISGGSSQQPMAPQGKIKAMPSLINFFKPSKSNKIDNLEINDGQSTLLRRISKFKDKQMHVGEAMHFIRERSRFNFDVQLVIYLIHLFLFLFMALTFIPVHYSFEQGDLIGSYFSSEQNEDYMNYSDVTTKDDIYKFLSLTILPGLRAVAKTTDDEENSIAYSQILVGGPIVRQVRVKAGECLIKFKNETEECYGYYDSGSANTTSFGPPNNPSKYKWKTGYSTLYPSRSWYRDVHLGTQDSYGTAGFVENFFTGTDIREDIVQELQEDDWLSRPTRAVAVIFTMYNDDLGFISSVEYLFELAPSGRIEPSRFIIGYRIIEAGDPNIGIFIAFCLATGLWIFNEVRLFWQDKRGYFSTLWNWLEVVNVGTYIALITLISLYLEGCKKLIDDLEIFFDRVDYSEYIDFQSIGLIYYYCEQVVGICCLLYFLKVFKFFRAIRKLNLVWRTLQLAGGTLLAYTFIFSVIFVAFSLQGYFLFGYQMKTFHAFPTSILTAFRMLSGDFSFSDMESASPIFGPVFFVLYMIFVFLILVNMFIAILSQYYESASREAREAEMTGNSIDAEYDITERVKKMRPRLVLPKKRDFLAIEHNSNLLVIISKQDIGHKLVDSPNLPILHLRSDLFNTLALKDLWALPKLSCFATEDTEYYRFALEMICSSINKDPTLPEELDPEIKKWYEMLSKHDDMMVALYRAEGYCRVTQFATISLRWGLWFQMGWNKIRGQYTEKHDVDLIEANILSNKELGTMLEKLCGATTSTKDHSESILGMTLHEFLKKTENLKLDPDTGVTLEDIFRKMKSQSTGAKVRLRFDELVREIRITVAMKNPAHLHFYSTADFMKEALRISELVPPRCYEPIEDIEEVAKNYNPRIMNIAGINIDFIKDLIDVIAEHVHDQWTLTKLNDGWKYDPVRDNGKKQHPMMVPYKDLTENEKSYDKNMAKQSIRLIVSLGYTIKKTGSMYTKRKTYTNFKDRLIAGYELNLADTESIILDESILELRDILAENAHDEWAQKRKKEGLRYGKKGSADPKVSHQLIPYFMMEPEDRVSDQTTALETLRIIIYYGYKIAKPDISAWEKFKFRILK
eukprot:TRINITY_DN4160_c0_g1_i4.p1 TRINITY_DN4160_c0_g1~~TRINITY_DN4160_c0_g1_i4.p1  ORF type:complete len:1093 (+),score=211.13 TRINITY_DN4160_c0_g1_i4:154-3432(+)